MDRVDRRVLVQTRVQADEPSARHMLPFEARDEQECPVREAKPHLRLRPRTAPVVESSPAGRGRAVHSGGESCDERRLEHHVELSDKLRLLALRGGTLEQGVHQDVSSAHRAGVQAPAPDLVE